ncbi:MAG: hypothetical protein PHU61_00010 [Candidatus Absconditabacteria bacterium]|nr:hypothetical protein [Candidatus Absconditabacteria bacterium]MDD4714210.1 hypothetical protein [Candidatus Absconditabacteria bacterium]
MKTIDKANHIETTKENSDIGKINRIQDFLETEQYKKDLGKLMNKVIASNNEKVALNKENYPSSEYIQQAKIYFNNHLGELANKIKGGEIISEDQKQIATIVYDSSFSKTDPDKPNFEQFILNRADTSDQNKKPPFNFRGTTFRSAS